MWVRHVSRMLESFRMCRGVKSHTLDAAARHSVWCAPALIHLIHLIHMTRDTHDRPDSVPIRSTWGKILYECEGNRMRTCRVPAMDARARARATTRRVVMCMYPRLLMHMYPRPLYPLYCCKRITCTLQLQEHDMQIRHIH